MGVRGQFLLHFFKLEASKNTVKGFGGICRMWEILLVRIENLEIVVELNHGHVGVALY